MILVLATFSEISFSAFAFPRIGTDTVALAVTKDNVSNHFVRANRTVENRSTSSTTLNGTRRDGNVSTTESQRMFMRTNKPSAAIKTRQPLSLRSPSPSQSPSATPPTPPPPTLQPPPPPPTLPPSSSNRHFFSPIELRPPPSQWFSPERFAEGGSPTQPSMMAHSPRPDNSIRSAPETSAHERNESLPAETSPTRYSVAVLVTGQFRGLKTVRRNFQAVLVNRLRGDFDVVTIVVTKPPDHSAYESFFGDEKSEDITIVHTVADTSFAAPESQCGGDVVKSGAFADGTCSNLTSYRWYRQFFFVKYPPAKLCSGDAKRGNLKCKYPADLLREALNQLVDQRIAYEEAMAYEARHRKAFTWFIRLRPDLDFQWNQQRVPFLQLANLSQDCTHVPKVPGPGVFPNDKFAVVPRSFAAAYFRRVDVLLDDGQRGPPLNISFEGPCVEAQHDVAKIEKPCIEGGNLESQSAAAQTKSCYVWQGSRGTARSCELAGYNGCFPWKGMGDDNKMAMFSVERFTGHAVMKCGAGGTRSSPCIMGHPDWTFCKVGGGCG